MLVSAAIIDGAKRRPQAFGGLVQYDTQGNAHTCALGAAFEAVGFLEIVSAPGRPGVLTTRLLVDPDSPFAKTIQTAMDDCPSPCGCAFGAEATLSAYIAHLNDTHSWTREMIAAWVARVERK